jgi:hypothetical protein
MDRIKEAQPENTIAWIKKQITVIIKMRIPKLWGSELLRKELNGFISVM